MRPAPRFDGRQACAGADPELFFPTAKGHASNLATQQAKALCRTCPHQDPCRSYALSQDVAGVWGGLTESDRATLRRRGRRSRAVAA